MMVEHLAEGVSVYLADCRDVLPGLQADAIITDPVWPNCPSGLLAGADDPFGLWRDVLAVMPPVKRLIAIMRTDSDPRFLAPVPSSLRFFRSIQLTYAVPNYLGRVLGGDEIAYWFGKPVASVPGRRVIPGRAPVAQPAGRSANGHPCRRAQVHFDWLVEWASDENETILDPFMGSGTTGVAAVKRGRRFIGVEIDEGFFGLACQRISAALAQPSLFVERRVSAKQGTLSLDGRG